jgi:YggT family protein
MIAIRFIVETLLQFLLVTVFLLRVVLPLVRADSRNPFSQGILQLTNPLVLPLRRALPPIGKFDTASLGALLLVQAATTAILWMLGSYSLDGGLQFVHLMLVQLVLSLLLLYRFALLIYILLSWVAPNTYSSGSRLLTSLCEPLLQPVRRLIPPIAGLDLSALFVLIGLQALSLLVASTLSGGFL